MRIGINASFARKENTGIGQLTRNFLKVLAKQRDGHEYFLYLEEELDLKLPKNFQQRVFLPIWKRDDLIRRIWWEKRLLPRRARRDNCDVLLSLYQSATVSGPDLPHIMVVNDIIPKIFPEYLNNGRKRKYWQLIERAIAAADRIVAISHRTEKDLIQKMGIEAGRITVSYPDVDEIYSKEISQRSGQMVLRKYGLKSGYIFAGGGLEVRKNIERVIRAYARLLEQNRRDRFAENLPELVISGKLMPELAPLVTDAARLVRELNLTSRVKLLDFVPQKDLPALYANAICFVYPSLYEGFGLPVLEAMRQNTPVITAKTSSLPEVGGDAALYCDPLDLDGIASVMKKVVTDKRVREEMVRRGSWRVANFSMEKFVSKISEITGQLKSRHG